MAPDSAQNGQVFLENRGCPIRWSGRLRFLARSQYWWRLESPRLRKKSFRCSLLVVFTFSPSCFSTIHLCELCQVTKGWWASVQEAKESQELVAWPVFGRLGWIVASYLIFISSLSQLLCSFFFFVPYGSPSDLDRGLVLRISEVAGLVNVIGLLGTIGFPLDLLDLGLVQDLLLVEWLQLARSDLPMTHSLYLFTWLITEQERSTVFYDWNRCRNESVLKVPSWICK